MSPTSSPLLDAGILPVVELLALCLDGHVFRVGDAFAPVDVPDGPELRAHAFARTTPGWVVADRGSAAWLHGTRPSPPVVPQVCLQAGRRGGVVSPALDVSHRSLTADDTIAVGPVLTTSPFRTAIDLLCAPGPFGAGEAMEVRALLDLGAVTPAECDQRLRSSRRKGCGVARSRLPAVARAVMPARVSLR